MVLCRTAGAQESKVQLKDGPGKAKAMQCVACHSLDYLRRAMVTRVARMRRPNGAFEKAR
jgi:hypothetical protein